jgi:hypothetical protein
MISRLRIDPIPLLTRSLLKLSQQGSLSQWDGAMEGRSQGMIGRLIISFLKCFVIDLHELIIQLLIALGWRHRKNPFGGGTADESPVLLIIIASSTATTGRSSPRFGMDLAMTLFPFPTFPLPTNRDGLLMGKAEMSSDPSPLGEQTAQPPL